MVVFVGLFNVLYNLLLLQRVWGQAKEEQELEKEGTQVNKEEKKELTFRSNPPVDAATQGMVMRKLPPCKVWVRGVQKYVVN
jgi:hypothetical protein